jgi:hypothetical protein
VRCGWRRVIYAAVASARQVRRADFGGGPPADRAIAGLLPTDLPEGFGCRGAYLGIGIVEGAQQPVTPLFPIRAPTHAACRRRRLRV